MINSEQRAPEAAEFTVRLVPAPRSVGDARRAIRAFCNGQGLSGLTDDAVLLTSELVTNACRVADGLITVLAFRDGNTLTITVIDDNSSEVRVPAGPPALAADDGRGLFLLDQLAGSWGTNRFDLGKSIWFRLP